MAPRYVVTGGAGFLGRHLIRRLVTEGNVVTSLDIADFRDEDLVGKVDAVKGDIRDAKIVSAAIKNSNIVVHAAAALPLYNERDIISTDVNGTANVLQAAYEHNIQKVIHISTTAVYGIPDHHPLVETDRLVGVGPYGKAKVRAEEICVDYRNKGMCIPIIRPKTFIGPERLGVFAILYEWAKDGKNFPILGNGNNRYQLLDVEDLCEAICLVAVGDRMKVNDTFNIGAKEFASMKEDFQAVLDHAGFGKRVKTLPAGPVVGILRMLERLHLSPLYEWVYETVSKHSFVSIDKAERILGFVPKYSNKDTLLRNYEWYCENLSEIENSSGISHTVPWSQGILRLAKIFF